MRKLTKCWIKPTGLASELDKMEMEMEMEMENSVFGTRIGQRVEHVFRLGD